MKNKVIDKAVEVLGSRKTAMGWLNWAKPELDGKKPMDLLETENGCNLVLKILSIHEQLDIEKRL